MEEKASYLSVVVANLHINVAVQQVEKNGK